MEPMSSRSMATSSTSSRSNNQNRKYRKLASKESVDDTLFGSTRASSSASGSRGGAKRSQLAGREIVNGSTNQEVDPPHRVQPSKAGASPKRVRAGDVSAVLPIDELQRIRNETRILTDSELEAIAAKKEADAENMRMHAKARKQHMMERAADAAKRAPKSDIEQLFDQEKDEVRKRAAILKDQAHDSVKLMKTLGARAAAFTIRDEQIKRKKQIEDDDEKHNAQINLMMELDRLEGLKRQEDVAEEKKAKRMHDRKVLEEQIQERREFKERAQKMIEKEGEEMLEKICQAQKDEEAREKDKVARAQRSMEEVRKFNEAAMAKKAEHARLLALEDEKVVEYQRKKAEDARLREEEDARKRQEAELRCAKLRSTQERAANEKAQLDELRAKRAVEARERAAREADLAHERKMKKEMDELRISREAQAMHRQRSKIQEALQQKKEYESIIDQVESDKRAFQENEERLSKKRAEHRIALQKQIEDKQVLAKERYVKVQLEGKALKQEYADELQKLENIRIQEVADLEAAGVNPAYLSEMKALDIAKARDC
ncbi:hypothetical protein H310_07424 [Aphanomyces invadans]|uniref:Cilia- and flagella-associated protein 45 n=1 Tax=Aphanomyces invadans TaxID=157072 RepID=A0A024U307_9STRA|nr:hypothetical protein H310_07424 [Aphanomyces invadans]ETV99972.1 hypothetical protein H310_07424 [Aphanomyces invadans]|eukprot:XP_008871390.1 hypothetical protein H310_07424 [Aphanomyces invadans]